MSQHQTFKRFGLAIAVLVLVVAGSESLSYGVGECLDGCSPTTPCPCAADGVCRPNRKNWGHYRTNWRTWPGETRGLAPTPTGQGTGGEPLVDPLDPYQTPPPEEEDLRVPRKAKKKKTDDGEDAAPLELPGELPAQPLPGPGPEEDAPLDLDPFGQLPEVPAMEDAPPALPASLRQAAVKMAMPRLTMQQRPRQIQSTNKAPRVASQPIRQASWQQPSSIPLINPASAVIAQPAANSLQQAVYYEASDQDE